MAKGLKGITVDIGGNTAPLDKALKGVNQTARDLQSELGSVGKALKFDPNNLELVKQKAQILKEEIAATKEKLSALKEAQAQVTAQYKAGTIDAGQYRAFVRELETTKSKLESLKDEKKSVSVIGAAFDGVKSKVQEVLDKLSPVAKGLQEVGKAAGGISAAGVKTVGATVEVAGKAFTAYTGAALAAGTAVVGLTTKAAGAADEINTISAQTGLSTKEIQKFQYASEVIDVPLETLTGSMAKLTRNMASATDPTKGTGEAFAKLGVQVRDSNGELRNNQDVFNEAITALGKMSNETERDALAMEIFGKSAQDLNPLIKGGADKLKELGDQAEKSGLILSQDALDNLNKYQDGIDVMKSSAGQAGNVLAGTFAGGLTDAVSVVNTMIPQVTGSLAKIFSGEDLAGGQAQLTQSLTKGMTDIISGFAKNLPTYINGFNAVITSILTAITAVLPTLINTVLPTLIQGFTDLISAIVPMIPVLLPIIADAALQIFMGLINGINLVLPQLMDMIPGLIQQFGDMLIQNLPTIITAGMQILISLINGITESIPQLIQTVIDLIPVIVKGLTDNLPALITAGIDLIVALATGLPQAIPSIIEALPEIINAIINGIMEQNWMQIGIDILTGIANGLVEGVKAIGKTIQSVASNLVDQFKNFLGIHSPSKVFADVVGKNLALGIGEGFTDSMDGVTKQMQDAVPKNFATSVSVTSNKDNAEQTAQSFGGLNESIVKLISGAGDEPTVIHLYLDGVFDQTVNVAKRMNQRAGRVIVPVGG